MSININYPEYDNWLMVINRMCLFLGETNGNIWSVIMTAPNSQSNWLKERIDRKKIWQC